LKTNEQHNAHDERLQNAQLELFAAAGENKQQFGKGASDRGEIKTS
jgi:hypothetical protein